MGVVTEQQLLLERRLDWRFLMPDPELRAVAYWGQPGTRLQAALEQGSAQFTNMSVGAIPKGLVDVVVVCGASALRSLASIGPLLRSGGMLYAEQFSPFSALRPMALTRIEESSHLLLRAGFETPEFFWHRPEFENCREIVPLGNRQIVKYVLSRQRADLLGRCKQMLGRAVYAAGHLHRVLPCVSMLARWP